jgi:aspartate carbamoyltransferase
MFRHIVSVNQFTKAHIQHLIERASIFKKRFTNHNTPSTFVSSDVANSPLVTFPDKTMVALFYEPSTRTSCSFQAAAHKLGCKVIAINEQQSSAKKGESLEDTIKTVQYYGDVIVLRHYDKGSSQKAANISNVPVINAGDGNGEHPTQALLDIYTIYCELLSRGINLFSEIRPIITITFVGDLKNSRTIHSLIHVLSLFPNVKFNYIAPPSLEMPEEIVQQINSLNISQLSNTNLYDCIASTDILYVTRIQKERFVTDRDYFSIVLNRSYKEFCITPDLLHYAKPSTIIMHPLPRSIELPADIDADPRAIYFTQVENGVYMRMAILESLFVSNTNTPMQTV